jgi:hypothetical protein
MKKTPQQAKKNRPTAQTVVTNTNETEDTQVSGSRPPQDTGTSDTFGRRGHGSRMRSTKFQIKMPRVKSQLAASGQSLASSDSLILGNSASPRKEPGIANVHAFRNKFDSSSTAHNQSLPPSNSSGNGNAPLRKTRGIAGIHAFRNLRPIPAATATPHYGKHEELLAFTHSGIHSSPRAQQTIRVWLPSKPALAAVATPHHGNHKESLAFMHFGINWTPRA